jgi:hypothetical protein
MTLAGRKTAPGHGRPTESGQHPLLGDRPISQAINRALQHLLIRRASPWKRQRIPASPSSTAGTSEEVGLEVGYLLVGEEDAGHLGIEHTHIVYDEIGNGFDVAEVMARYALGGEQGGAGRRVAHQRRC